MKETFKWHPKNSEFLDATLNYSLKQARSAIAEGLLPEENSKGIELTLFQQFNIKTCIFGIFARMSTVERFWAHKDVLPDCSWWDLKKFELYLKLQTFPTEVVHVVSQLC